MRECRARKQVSVNVGTQYTIARHQKSMEERLNYLINDAGKIEFLYRED
jgi:hypothetical protein